MASLVVGGGGAGWAARGAGVSGLVGVFCTWNKETRSSSDETMSSPEVDGRNIE